MLVVPLLPPDIKVHTNLDEDLPPIVGDPTQLRQVLMNLIVNAGEAIGAASGAIDVTARRVSRDDARVEIAVCDSGSGLDATMHIRLFEPFFSTKGDGRGFGLAIVLGIVRAHGGSIEVDSAPGQGTTFRIFLPTQPLELTA